MGKRGGKGGGKSGATADRVTVAKAAGSQAPARGQRSRGPGLLDRLTWLVLVAFLVLLAVAHG